MQRLGLIPRVATAMVVLTAVVLLALFPASPGESLAQPPPPPTKTSIVPGTETPTDIPGPTDTSEPPTPTTEPPTATTEPPTATSEPPTATSEPPTATSIPPTPVPATVTVGPSATHNPGTGTPPVATGTTMPHPSETAPAEPTQRPKPGCHSVIEGEVLNATGQRTPGATVHIESGSYSNQILTDDAGHYGFSGLCAGTYTLQATLPAGRLTTAASAAVDGQNSAWIALRIAGAVITGTPTATPTRSPVSTSQPDMPVTGYPGWLFIGGALFGAMLLLSAGARRAFRRG